MTKATKIWLIAAAALILLGTLLFVGVMTALKWDFEKLSTEQYETDHHTVTEAFNAISVDINTADIALVPSANGGCSVECYERQNVKHTVAVRDGVLVIEVVDEREWYEHIGISTRSPWIKVYLPAGSYGALSVKSNTGDVSIPAEFEFESVDIKEDTGDVTLRASAAGAVRIETDTGDVCVENVSAEAMEISVSTGDVELAHVNCDSLASTGSTGDISLKNVIVTGKLTVERSTGDVELEACDAAELFIETDTGDVEGSLLSDKVFIVETDTGNKRVPDTTAGGRCEIVTDTGDVEMVIKK